MVRNAATLLLRRSAARRTQARSERLYSSTPIEIPPESSAAPPKKKYAPIENPYPRPPPPPKRGPPHHNPSHEFPSYQSPDYFSYEILHTSRKSRARVGRIHTPHGVIDTPGFVAVGTNATIKALDVTTADETGLQLMFCNTYHLLLHPGPDTIQRAGGLHSFMNRNRPIITDSGGFQVFSLAYGSVEDELNMKARRKYKDQGSQVMKISEEGVKFRSYRDGRIVELTPESSVAAQKSFGADIIIPLDELPPYHIEPETLRASVHRTHRWETRSLLAHRQDPRKQAMYAVVHGGVDYKLRQESIDYLSSLPFDGYAIGGALGKDRTELVDLLKFVMPRIPADKPNHLLGIADDISVELCIPLGVDTFDSAYPTRAARHGTLFTRNGRVQIDKGRYAQDLSPIDPKCSCRTCRLHTASYLYHLFKANEPTGHILATIHNLQFMMDYMSMARMKIMDDQI